VLQSVQAARLGRGLPQLAAFPGGDAEIARVVDGLQRGGLSPQDALDSLLAFAARSSGGSARGIAIQTATLDALDLPAETYSPGENHAAIVATPYRPAGEPWWRWIVLIVVCPR
jgi:hypothetical protein